MSAKTFIDTNVLIYAHDLDAGSKHAKAKSLLAHLWQHGNGVLSTQVLQEFYVTITRKIAQAITPPLARGIIENYLAWEVVQNNPESILHASEIEQRHQLSFWDALIISAASSSKAEKILTEDLNHGQVIEGVLIENPFI